MFWLVCNRPWLLWTGRNWIFYWSSWRWRRRWCGACDGNGGVEDGGRMLTHWRITSLAALVFFADELFNEGAETGESLRGHETVCPGANGVRNGKIRRFLPHRAFMVCAWMSHNKPKSRVGRAARRHPRGGSRRGLAGGVSWGYKLQVEGCWSVAFSSSALSSARRTLSTASHRPPSFPIYSPNSIKRGCADSRACRISVCS